MASKNSVKKVNLAEALASRRPIRCPSRQLSYTSSLGGVAYIAPDAWLDPDWLLSMVHLRREEVLNRIWETKPDRLAELQDRIHFITQETGIHPKVLDVTEEVFTELHDRLCSQRNAISEWGRGTTALEFLGVRIVKGRVTQE